MDRQLYLAQYREITPDIKQGIYPFRNIKLSRADVEWLLATHANGLIVWSNEQQCIGLGLDLRGADLRGVNLQNLPLACIRGGLDDREWRGATLEEREAARIQMEGTNLQNVHMEGAILRRADFRGANLERAHLEGADFYRAHLEGAYLRNAYLGGASLQRVFFDTTTSFEDVSIQDRNLGCTLFADAYWNGMHLSNVNWVPVKMLGDDFRAYTTKKNNRKKQDKNESHNQYRKAVRANRQLASVLQAEGLNEEAARFAYRAHLLQRKVYWGQRNFWRYLFSLFLGLLTGYGFKPARSFITYLVVIGLFMLIYHGLGIAYGPHLGWEESLVVSMTAFHGRGFFPDQFRPGDPQALVAAIEAFVGLIIEVTFIASLTK